MEKVSLPIKTKIAAWWIRILAIILLIRGIFDTLSGMWLRGHEYMYPPFPLTHAFSSVYLKFARFNFIFSILLFFFSYFLFKGRKWSWIGSLALLIVNFIDRLQGFVSFLLMTARLKAGIMIGYFSSYFFFLIAFLLPIILLLLDRKNFFKVAT